MRRVVAVSCLVLAATAWVDGANFWDTDPYLQWSDKQVRKVMTNSPWAATIVVSLPQQIGGVAPARRDMRVFWSSARPVREAIVRAETGRGKTPTARQQSMLAQPGLYVVTLDNVPYPFQPKQVMAFLLRKNKPPIVAQQLVADKTQSGWAVQVSFPRTDPITLADGEVEFALRAESFGAGIALSRPFEVKKTFALKRMTVSGALEL